jgi:GntR family transcriptional regulator
MTDPKLNLDLDFHSGSPIYIQIVNHLQGQLVNKVLKPGDQLPTVRALAQELKVNFNTVARAYRILNEARIISTQQGRGTYIIGTLSLAVGEKLKRESLETLTKRFIAEAIRLGYSEYEVSQMVRNNLKQN